jgi:hypothetical protein
MAFLDPVGGIVSLAVSVFEVPTLPVLSPKITFCAYALAGTTEMWCKDQHESSAGHRQPEGHGHSTASGTITGSGLPRTSGSGTPYRLRSSAARSGVGTHLTPTVTPRSAS